MDRFELDMDQGGPHEHRDVRPVRMEEQLEGAHAFHDLLRWRWHERGVARARATNPVLARSKLARLLLTAAPLGEQDLVNLAEQPKG